MNIYCLFYDSINAGDTKLKELISSCLEDGVVFYTGERLTPTKDAILTDIKPKEGTWIVECDITVPASPDITDEDFTVIYVGDSTPTNTLPDWVKLASTVIRTGAVPSEPLPTRIKKSERAARISLGYMWKGIEFQTRDEDIKLIMGKVTSLLAMSYLNKPVGTVEWRSSDNTMVTFEPDEFIEFALGIEAHIEAQYIASWL